MTDLKTVNDHPSVVLQRSAAAYQDLGVNLDDNGWMAAGFRAKAENYREAVKELGAYETDHDVTFAALDNETLAAIRDVWDDNDTPVSELLRLVEDLLGLDDE